MKQIKTLEMSLHVALQNTYQQGLERLTTHTHIDLWKPLFKELLALHFLFIILGNSNLFSQCNKCPELIINPDLTIDVPNIMNYPNGTSTFENNDVPAWFATYKSPHHMRYLEGQICDRGNLTLSGGTVINCFACTSDNSNNEGLHTNLDFINNQYLSYCVSFDYERINCENNPPEMQSNIVVRAGNNLPINSYLNPTSATFGNYDFHIIGDISVTDYDPHNFTANFSPSMLSNPRSFESFQIFQFNASSIPAGTYVYSAVTLENISVTCQTSALTGINHSTDDPSDCGLTVYFSPLLDHNGCEEDESYKWSISGLANEFATTENASYTFSATGEYEVCLDYTDCYGCCAQVCKTISVKDCGCPLPEGFTLINANGGVNISDLFPNQSSFNGVSWMIRGELHIDRNTSILGNSRLLMESGSQIVVNQNVRFISTSNTYEACDKMWKGIQYNGGDFLQVFNGNHISDAKYALELNGKTRINLIGNTFNKNFIGVYSQNTSPILNRFSDNYFICEDVSGAPTFLRDPYIGQTDYPIGFNNPAVPEPVSYCGIRLVGVPYIDLISDEIPPNVGAANTFRNIRCGIISSNSGINCGYLNFINLRGNKDLYTSDFSGVGISSSGSSDVSINNCTFNNGHRAIRVDHNNMTKIIVNDNHITNFAPVPGGINYLSGGILMYNDKNNSEISIKHNIANNCYLGIELDQISGFSILEVAENDINDANNPDYALGIGLISVNGNTAQEAHGRIAHNHINGYYNKGIWLNNSHKNIAMDNEVILNSPLGSTSKGFNIEISSNNQIRGNNVDGNIGLSGYGYCTALALNNLYCCNIADNLGFGFEFYGNCNTTRWRGNTMINNETQGLRYRSTTVGPQVHHGNIWKGTGQSAQYLGVYDDVNRITADPADLPPSSGSTLIPTSVNVNQWFLPQSGITQFCDNVCDEQIWLNPHCGTTDEIEELERMAQGDVLENEYEDQNLWSSQLYLYNYLTDHPNLLSCSTILSGYMNNPPAGVQAYHDAENTYDHLYDASASEQHDYENANAAYENDGNTLAGILTSLDENNYASYASQIETLQTNIATNHVVMQNIAEAINARAIQNAITLKATLLGLIQNYSFNTVEKDILSIRCDEVIHGLEYLRSHHLVQLVSIAESCALEYGAPVYHAQALLHFLNVDWDKENDACANLTPRSSRRSIDDLVVSPNPSSGIFNIKIPDAISGSITVYDQLQKEVKRQDYGQNTKEVVIDLSSFANGVYIITMSNAVDQRVSQKIILVK